MARRNDAAVVGFALAFGIVRAATAFGQTAELRVLASNGVKAALEDLVPQCEARGRWEFFFVAAPLRLVGGTGSPLNPIAIF